MATVTGGPFLRPDGTPLTGTARFQLVADGGRALAEANRLDNTDIIVGYAEVDLDVTGAYSIDLVPNADLAPAGTRWARTSPAAATKFLDVVTGGGDEEAMYDDPPGAVESSALTVHKADLTAHGDPLAALAGHEADDEAHGDPLGALADHEALAVAGAGAHGHVEHSWARDGWAPLTPVVVTADAGQAFTLTVAAGRGRATSAAGNPAGNHRVWYLHPATDWARARVTTTLWGPSNWTTPNRPQLGLVLGAQRPDPVGSPNRWVAFVVWYNIIGVDATPAGLLANGWDITGTSVTLGNGGGAGGGISAVNRQAVVVKAEHLSFLGSELSVMRVTPPWASIIANGTPFVLTGMEDPDYDIAAGVVGGAAAGDINITAELDAAPTNPADNIAGGLLVPARPWDACPYKIAAERTGPATIRVAQWAYGAAPPDEGDPRWTSVTITQGAMGAFPTDAAGLHGILVGHAHSGSYAELGDLTFEQR